jgi:dTDP-4-dehydrorhamnose 3,5-epimerase
MAELGIDCDFVEDNHNFSARRGTLRGLHFQQPPGCQAKMVRCVVGAIWDVAVDLRAGSPTFGQWMGSELSALGGEQLFVPEGFGHGFVTLMDNCEVAYKTSAYYDPALEQGIRWDDPALAIRWPLDGVLPIVSEKDRALPMLAQFQSSFTYQGTPLAALD